MDRDVTYGIPRLRSENVRETAEITDLDVPRILRRENFRRYAAASQSAILSLAFYSGLRSGEIRNPTFGGIGEIKGIKVLRLHIKGGNFTRYPCILQL